MFSLDDLAVNQAPVPTTGKTHRVRAPSVQGKHNVCGRKALEGYAKRARARAARATDPTRAAVWLGQAEAYENAVRVIYSGKD